MGFVNRLLTAVQEFRSQLHYHARLQSFFYAGGGKSSGDDTSSRVTDSGNSAAPCFSQPGEGREQIANEAPACGVIQMMSRRTPRCLLICTCLCLLLLGATSVSVVRTIGVGPCGSTGGFDAGYHALQWAIRAAPPVGSSYTCISPTWSRSTQSPVVSLVNKDCGRVPVYDDDATTARVLPKQRALRRGHALLHRLRNDRWRLSEDRGLDLLWWAPPAAGDQFECYSAPGLFCEYFPHDLARR